MIFKLGELFSGPGGIGKGAQLARVGENRIEHEWATDFDKDTCTTYEKNLSNGKKNSVICKDIRELDYNSLNNINALAFGFPCNDFSIVGEQKGIDGVYGPLYAYGVAALRHFNPLFFLAENVGGLRNSNDGDALKKILEELQLAGYNVYPHYYKFEQYGVPQSRHRIIIIGIRDDQDVKFKIPAPTHESPVTCSEAILIPPIQYDAYNHDFTKQSEQVIRRLMHIRPGENAFNADIPEELRLNVKNVKISQIYRRLDPDKPAYTITGSGGGGTHVYHWEENRALTNRERARLQTFPDDFIFYGSKESVRKQIGMAVPVLAARVIFEAVLKSFAGIQYEYVEPNLFLNPILELTDD